MTTARVVATRLHDTHNFSNPTKTDTMEFTESDSRADTTCAVNNMTLLSYTGYKCNVIGFHYDLKTMKRIPVALEVTAYDEPLSGTTVILVFNQALWFGSSMGQSLINTNQTR